MIAIITQEQRDSIFGQKLDGVTYFNPQLDYNGKWYISSEEIEQTTDPNFLWVKDLALTGNGTLTEVDADSIDFINTDELLVVNGKSKKIEKTLPEIPSRANLDALRSHLLTKYGAFDNFYYQRKDGLVHLYNGESVKIIAVANMTQEEYDIFNNAGMDALSLYYQP